MNEKNFESEFKRRYPERSQILNYIKDALNINEIHFSDMTSANLTDVAKYIKSQVAPGTAKVYFAILPRFIKIYKETEDVPCNDPHDTLKTKLCPQENVALTKEELSKIEAYYDSLMNKVGRFAEKDVLTLFLLECYTGARSCDCEKMSLENVRDGKLSYVADKTMTLVTLPVHYKVNELLQNIPARTYAEAVKVRIIKRVAKSCGINDVITITYRGVRKPREKYEYLGTHTARRTFSTLLDELGVPLTEITQYMGHSDVKMTMRYIKRDRNKVSESALAFFNG